MKILTSMLIGSVCLSVCVRACVSVCTLQVTIKEQSPPNFTHTWSGEKLTKFCNSSFEGFFNTARLGILQQCCSYLEKNLSNLHETFSTDVSSDNDIFIKFWNSYMENIHTSVLTVQLTWSVLWIYHILFHCSTLPLRQKLGSSPQTDQNYCKQHTEMQRTNSTLKTFDASPHCRFQLYDVETVFQSLTKQHKHWWTNGIIESRNTIYSMTTYKLLRS